MRQLPCLLLILLILPATQADERSVDSRITSVGLFKNGLAVVERLVEVPSPGTYRVDDVPVPVHGTFWIESDAKITARLTHRMVEVPVGQSPAGNFQEELVGKQVLVYFDHDVPPASGTVVEFDLPSGEAAWNRSYERQRYNYWYHQSGAQSGPARYLVLESDAGRSYVDVGKMVHMRVTDPGGTVNRRKPALLFDVVGEKKKPAMIEISYLSKGMAWAPGYRVDVSDPHQLAIRQKAVIKNEMADIEDAEIRLISGFPSVQFGHVVSPLSLQTTWATFFGQLNRQIQSGHVSLGNAMSQQAVSFNRPAPDSGIDLSAVPSGEGVDLHYQEIGPQTLAEGDSLSLDVASGNASYERIVEWVIPDTRHATGRYVTEHERQRDPDKYQDAAWDAVRFKNPLPFPMTTGPAMIVADGRFNGQRMSFWVNRGEETTLHVTKALSIRTRNVEHEEESKREGLYIGGDHYLRVPVKGELTANNHRNETVTLLIRRRFSGNLIEADGEPKSDLLEEGVFSINKRNELTWSVELKPAKEIKLTYRYTVLVPH